MYLRKGSCHTRDMSFKRKLAAGAAVLLLAGGGAGAGLAASGRSGPVRETRHAPPFHVTHAGFVRSSAWFLGLGAATLRHEVKDGRTIADVADATAGKSAQQLTAYLVHGATVKLAGATARALSASQLQMLHSLLRRRITGFLHDTCPLSLVGIAKHLGGCKGMHA